MSDQYRKVFSEAMLRYAVIENHNREMAELPSDEELAKLYTFSDRHNARMKALFSKEARKAALKAVFKMSKRVAAVLIISIAVLFAALLTNSDVRAAVGRTIVEWFEGFTSFRFQGEETENMDGVWVPEYLPDGFTLTAEYPNDLFTSVEYGDQAGVVIYFDYSSDESFTVSTDNENSDYEIVVHEGIEYHVFTAKSDEYRSKILWKRGSFGFSLVSALNSDELLKMALSVTPKK